MLTPAYAICSLIRIPFLGPVICLAFLLLAYGLVYMCLNRSNLWLTVVCVILAAISTASSREIYQQTKRMIGHGLPNSIVQESIFAHIFLKGE